MKIIVVSGYGYWGNFLPSDLDKGVKQIGGGETAMISISRELARKGHDVMVFYDVAYPGRYDGVDYLPTSMFVPMVCQLEHDVLISWDNPHIFRFADRAALRVLAFQLNATQIGVFDYTIDRYMHPSKWHAERYNELYPEITPENQMFRLTNGIDLTRYEKKVEREPHRVIYSSSPDRGLHHLLDVWPKVRKEVEDAELHIFYEIDNWLQMAAMAFGMPNIIKRGEYIKEFKENAEKCQQLGVTFHGGVGQKQLAEEQMRSAIMAYPCDPVQPTEGFSMTCLEAVTAGCSLITTDADALLELWADAPGVTILPLPFKPKLWVSTIVKELLSEETRTPTRPLQYAWATVAQTWEEEFKECLKQ